MASTASENSRQKTISILSSKEKAEQPKNQMLEVLRDENTILFSNLITTAIKIWTAFLPSTSIHVEKSYTVLIKKKDPSGIFYNFADLL